MDFILEQPKPMPVIGEYDVAVCGGGIAGVAAALSAVRTGAKTVLIEREFALGGLATLGLVTIYLPICDGRGHQVSFGIAEELLKLSMSHGAEARVPELWLRDATVEERAGGKRYEVQFNAQLYAILMEELLKKEGVDILYGTTVAGAVTVENRITHLALENKSGRVAVRAKSVVDSTGDADLCRMTGERSATYSQKNILAAWNYTVDGEGKFKLTMLGCCEDPNVPPEELAKRADKRYVGIDGQEVSEFVQDSHASLLRKFLSEGELSDDHILATMATIPQLRMTRRIDGAAVMNESDDHKYCPESVGLFPNWRKRGPIYELPFGAITGTSIENLFFAGRCISADDTLWDITRVIPVCSVTGEAAGIAASLSAGGAVKAEDVQKVLRDRNVPLHIGEIL